LRQQLLVEVNISHDFIWHKNRSNKEFTLLFYCDFYG